jgi:hypothetical protein
MIPFAAMLPFLAKAGATAGAAAAKGAGVAAKVGAAASKGASMAKAASPFIKGLMPMMSMFGGGGAPQVQAGPQMMQPGSIDLAPGQQMQRPMIPPMMQRFY